MPSRPLSADRKAITALHTRVDVEASDISHGRTERAAAVPRLVQLVPPARLDLVDEVLARIGKRSRSARQWPPYLLVCELAAKVKAVHAGDVRMRGASGEVVDVITYVDKMQQTRRLYRLSVHGVFVGEFKTPEELGRKVDLATLVEDEPPGPDRE